MEDVEYEEDFFPENENIKFYNQNGINLIGGSGAIDSTSLEKGTMLSIGTVYAEKNQGIGIRLNITPSDKSVQYGIITSDNKKRFVYGTGSCYHVFQLVIVVTMKSLLKILVQKRLLLKVDIQFIKTTCCEKF